MSYFSIHNHTDYSSIRLLDSINKTKDLIDRAIELGLSGVCITDHEVLSSHVEAIRYYKGLPKDVRDNFTLGLGDEIYLIDELGNKPPLGYSHFILVAKDQVGHRALREISSTAWSNSYTDRGTLRVPITKSQLSEIVKKFPGSLIASSACLGSELSQLTLLLIKKEKEGVSAEEIHGIKVKIVELITYCKDLFQEDYYIEVQPGIYSEQIEYNNRIKSIANALEVKLVFSTDSHYLRQEDREIHKAYLNSKEAEREVDDFYATSYMMSLEEIYDYLKNQFTESEFKQMTDNTNEIKSKITTYDLFKPQVIPYVEIDTETISPFLKKYEKSGYEYIDKMISSIDEQDRFWIGSTLKGYEEKTLCKPYLNQSLYLERVNTEAMELWEISIKLNSRMTKYYNTMAHLVKLMWEAGAMVGIARGSATGYLTNYYLEITQLDPVEWDLPHWRHLSSERPELAK